MPALLFIEALLEDRLDCRHRRRCIGTLNFDLEFGSVSRSQHHQLDNATRVNLLIAMANGDSGLKFLGYLSEGRGRAQMESKLVLYFQRCRERIHAHRIKVRAEAVNGVAGKVATACSCYPRQLQKNQE
jgi:hypothetical protein